MYEQVFQFHSRPFTSTPFVKHYFAAEAIQDALARTRVCIDRASGPSIVVGATGTGKTLMLSMLEDQYHSQFRVVNLACARLDSRQSLLQTILFELDQPINGLTENELRFGLIEFLKPGDHCPNGILLLIDEAHSLDQDLLDEVRLITNFVRDGQPRVRLVMAGTSSLEDKLNDPRLDSFNQRIAARCYLNNLSREDTTRYIIEHIDRVGGNGNEFFSEDALREIHELTQGCPRLINQICDHALIKIATVGTNTVDLECAREAWSVIQAIPGLCPTSSSNSNQTTLEDNPEWTVLEFGQLEDEDGTPEQATVYEIQSEPSFSQSESLDSNESIDPEPEPEPLDPAATHTMEQLQRAIANLEGVAPTIENQTEKIDSEDSESVSELIQGLEPVASEEKIFAGPLESEFTEDPYSPTNQEKETQFGQESTVSIQTEQGGGDDHLEQPVLEQTVDFDQETPNDPTETVESTSEPTVPADQEQHQEPTTATGAIDQPDPWTESFTEEVLVADATPQNVEPLSNVVEPELKTGEQLDNDGQEPPIESTVQEFATMANPFDEQFDEEEHLVDRYGPFVAYQNQSALTLSSADLRSLCPIDTQSSVDATQSTNAPSETAIHPEETQGRVETEVTAEMPQDQSDSKFGGATASEETEQEAWVARSNFQEPAPQEELIYASLDEDDGSGSPESDTPSVFIIPGQIPDEPIPPAKYQFQAAPDDESVVSDAGLQNEPALQPEQADSEASIPTPVPGGLESATTNPIHSKPEPQAPQPKNFHEHITEAVSTDIEREAEEILQRLNLGNEERSAPNQPVSHETGKQATSGTSTGFEEPEDALQETQQILNEILAQKSLLTQQRDAYESPTKSELDASIEIEYPPGVQDPQHTDDQNMIVVNEPESEIRTTKPGQEEPVPFPSTPISTGNAERMDYQKLFDQLRDQGGSPTS